MNVTPSKSGRVEFKVMNLNHCAAEILAAEREPHVSITRIGGGIIMTIAVRQYRNHDGVITDCLPVESAEWLKTTAVWRDRSP